MNTTQETSFLIAISLLVAGYLAISPPRASAQTSATDSQEVNSLLSQSKAEAHELELDAEHMATFTRLKLSFESHTWKLDEVKEHINKSAKLLAELENARGSGSAWQQNAIDDIRPLLQEAVNNTTSAIEFCNENQNRIHLSVPPYETYLTENYEVARELAALITDYVDYGKHKANFERLGEKLQLASR